MLAQLEAGARIYSRAVSGWFGGAGGRSACLAAAADAGMGGGVRPVMVTTRLRSH